MNAGDLIHRVSLIRDVVTRTNGAASAEPATYADGVPARVEYLSGHELFKAQQINAQINVRVTLRYRSDVLSSDRVGFNGREFQIIAPRPDEVRRQSLILECRA